MFIVPVYAVLCYTITKHGLCRVCKRRKSTHFTYDASVVFLKLDSNKRPPTWKCWDVLDHYVLYPQSAQALSYSENGRRANPKVSAVQEVGQRCKHGWPTLRKVDKEVKLEWVFFVASVCLSCFKLVYFQYMYFLSTITHSRFRLTSGLLLYPYLLR